MIKFFKNLEFWKVFVLGASLIVVVLVVSFSNVSIRTKWGSIFKDRHREMTKVKSQTNYALNMKGAMINNLCIQYEFTLREYIKEKGYSISENKIKADVKYYKLIAIAMSDACEDITIDRYIHNNDLYRYQNKNDWRVFKQTAINVYMRKGTEVIENLYDNSKVILPLHEWHRRAGKEIYNILEKNADEMLELLKLESCIYYDQSNGGSR